MATSILTQSPLFFHEAYVNQWSPVPEDEPDEYHDFSLPYPRLDGLLEEDAPWHTRIAEAAAYNLKPPPAEPDYADVEARRAIAQPVVVVPAPLGWKPLGIKGTPPHISCQLPARAAALAVVEANRICMERAAKRDGTVYAWRMLARRGKGQGILALQYPSGFKPEAPDQYPPVAFFVSGDYCHDKRLKVQAANDSLLRCGLFAVMLTSIKDCLLPVDERASREEACACHVTREAVSA